MILGIVLFELQIEAFEVRQKSRVIWICLRKSLFLGNFKKHQPIPDCNYSRDKRSAEPSSLAFQSYLRSCEYLHLARRYHVWKITIFTNLPYKTISATYTSVLFFSRLKLITRELVSRLSIAALPFSPNILGVSFLGPILKRVMYYSEFYYDRLEKFWFFFHFCSSQFKQTKPSPTTQP